MKAYRLARRPYANSLSGKGAALKGARWNSAGVEMIYTALNRSLALAEVAVHLTAATVPDDYMMVVLDVPDDLEIQEILTVSLSDGWNVFPYSRETQSIGDEFIRKNRIPVLKVPSAVVRGDFNLLLNPHHPAFKAITIEQMERFPFDSRMFRSLPPDGD
jgi:RES domain-containing protein